VNDLAFARMLHVLGVVLWIGGVAFVTLVLLPGLRDMCEAQRSTKLTGLSGLYMVWRLDLWSRFADPGTGGCTRWCCRT